MLELLKQGVAGAMLLKDGTHTNYGVIRIENGLLIYYTGKGLREMWKPKNEEERQKAEGLKALIDEPDGEDKLIALGYISRIALNQIERIIH